MLRAVLCMTVVHNDTHTHVSSSYIFACQLNLDFFLSLLLFFCLFFHVSLGNFVLVLLAFVVLGFVSSVLSQGIGWEEHL